MPIYVYGCECGRKFETFRSIDRRNEVTCECGGTPWIIPQPFSAKICDMFRVIGHDGKLIGEKPMRERTPMLPEKTHGSRW